MARLPGASAAERVRCDGPGGGAPAGPARHRAPDGAGPDASGPDVAGPDAWTSTVPIGAGWSGYGRHAASALLLRADDPRPVDRSGPGRGRTAAPATSTLTVTIASPTADVEAATAKLSLRLREQLAASGRTPPAGERGLTGLVVSEPHASTDPSGRVWYWFRGTVRVSDRPGVRPGTDEPPRTPTTTAAAPASAWPVRPVPRPHGTGWECRLTTAAAAARVRRDLRVRLRRASAAGYCTVDAGEDLLLAFEELTSNAFRHGAGAVDVTIAAAAAGWLLVVDDEALDRPPVRVVGRDRALGGMGLEMVQRLARDFGWQPDVGRKRVWVELPSRR